MNKGKATQNNSTIKGKLLIVKNVLSYEFFIHEFFFQTGKTKRLTQRLRPIQIFHNLELSDSYLIQVIAKFDQHCLTFKGQCDYKAFKKF